MRHIASPNFSCLDVEVRI